MSNLYSVGQMNQLGDSFEVEGFTADDVTKLRQYSNLAGIKAVLNGTAKIQPVGEDVARTITINETTIAVNLGAVPKPPFDGTEVEQHIGKGWSIVEKRTDGLYVDGRKVILHLSKRQKNGKLLKGHELREELTGKPVLDANIFDALLSNLHLIPEDWKKDENDNTRYIFFWGTIYRYSNDDLCVRFMFYSGSLLNYGNSSLDLDWDDNDPAALLASY